MIFEKGKIYGYNKFHYVFLKDSMVNNYIEIDNLVPEFEFIIIKYI